MTGIVRICEVTKGLVDAVAIDRELIQQRLNDMDNMELRAVCSLIDAVGRTVWNEASRIERKEVT